MPTKNRKTLINQAPWYSRLDAEIFGRVMQTLRDIAHPGNRTHASYVNDNRGYLGGTAQRTYLLPRFEQEDIFLNDRYIKGKEKDYGLVKKAVNGRNIPVYQTAPDAIDRKDLIPIGNTYGKNSYGFINPLKDLVHSENHPSTIYIGTDNKLYQKAWDLNDYGGNQGTSSTYSKLFKLGSNILDIIGNPVVVTTGYQPIINTFGQTMLGHNKLDGVTIQDLFDYDDEGEAYSSTIGTILDNFMQKQGLHRENVNNKWTYILPDVVITGKHKRRSLSGKY